MMIQLDGNEMLLVRGSSGTLAVVTASKQRRFLVEAPEREIVLGCDIIPGEHLEQHLLCGVKEFDGAEIIGVKGCLGLKWEICEKKHFL